jgi:hypothetical protein
MPAGPAGVRGRPRGPGRWSPAAAPPRREGKGTAMYWNGHDRNGRTRFARPTRSDLLFHTPGPLRTNGAGLPRLRPHTTRPAPGGEVRPMPAQPLDTTTATALVTAATAAPSLHNAQPWRFRFRSADGVLELWADLDRAMPHTDPDNRALYLGCGAALCNLRVAAAHLASSLVPSPGPGQGQGPPWPGGGPAPGGRAAVPLSRAGPPRRGPARDAGPRARPARASRPGATGGAGGPQR